MASIKDVAARAGLSVAAVSKYLKDAGSVRDDTRSRIEQAIRELSYVPSPIARSLRTKRTDMIAVVVPSITNPFFTELFDAIRAECEQRSVLAVLYTIPRPADNLRTIRSILHRQPDGIILCFPDSEDFAAEMADRAPRMPSVSMSWHKAAPGMCSIILNVRRGIRDTAEHLLSLGCRRIAYIGGYPDSVISKEKYAGFKDALTAHGLSPDIRLVKRGETSMRYGYRAAGELLGTGDAPDALPDAAPDAAVCENDAVAIGCVNYCLQHGIRIPERFRVTGFDDIPLASMFQPALTTVRLPIAEMGKLAAGMALGREKDPRADADCSFETALVIRGTT